MLHRPSQTHQDRRHLDAPQPLAGERKKSCTMHGGSVGTGLASLNLARPLFKVSARKVAEKYNEALNDENLTGLKDEIARESNAHLRERSTGETLEAWETFARFSMK